MENLGRESEFSRNRMRMSGMMARGVSAPPLQLGAWSAGQTPRTHVPPQRATGEVRVVPTGRSLQLQQ